MKTRQSEVAVVFHKHEREIMKTIYVGNLPFGFSAAKINDVFSAHGTVYSVKLITDRLTGKHRGFGFVAMDDAGATTAISALNKTNFNGHKLRVTETWERINH